jgi:glycosyltransferase involved in cell wall biosynthesis
MEPARNREKAEIYAFMTNETETKSPLAEQPAAPAVPWAEHPGILPVVDAAGKPLPTAPGISVFFPAYNDGGTIASMVLEALDTCARVTTDYEVIVIDDASTDYTPELLDSLAANYEHMRVIHHEKNRGYGGALQSGFAAATKELVFYTDGDAQYDPRELVVLLARMTPKVDIVQGYKIERHDPVFRIVIGKLYHWTVKGLFGLHVRDTDCDFRLIRKSALDRITLESTSGTICLELMKKLQNSGARFAQVPVHHYHRVYGRSQFFNFPRLWRTGTQLLQLWWTLVVQQDQRRGRPAGPAASGSTVAGRRAQDR